MLKEVRFSVSDERDGEIAVEGLMKEVVESATELMINKHLDRVAVPYTVRCVTSEILDFIHCAFVGQDTGEVRPDGWGGGALPGEIVVDSWARGALGVKTKVINTAVSTSHLGDTHQMGTTRSVRRGISGSQLSSIDRSLRKHEKQERERASLIDDHTRTKSFRASKRKSEVSHLPVDGDVEGTADDDSLANMTPEEVEYTLQVKAEAKKKTETKALADKLTKQMDELKNAKDVIVDGPSGRVIQVKAFDAKMAAHSKKMEPKFVVPVTYDATVEPLTSKEGKGTRRGTQAMPTRKPRRDGNEFVQEENTYGPMVENVQPSGGVVVKEGDQTRRADLKVPKTKLTRSEFKKMVDSHTVQDPADKEGGDDSTPRRDPDNPSVSVLPAPTGGKSPASPLSPGGQKSRTSIVAPQGAIAQPQDAKSPSSEFKTQKVAALPSSTSPRSTASPIKAQQLKAAVHQAELQHEQARSKKHVPTKVVVHQGLSLDEDEEY